RTSSSSVHHPITGTNIWPLCKRYGRVIGYSMLEPDDFRHAVAMEILEHEHDLEAVREMLCHVRIGAAVDRARPQTARRGSAQSRVWSGSRSRTSQRGSADGRAAR